MKLTKNLGIIYENWTQQKSTILGTIDVNIDRQELELVGKAFESFDFDDFGQSTVISPPPNVALPPTPDLSSLLPDIEFVDVRKPAVISPPPINHRVCPHCHQKLPEMKSDD